MAKVLQKVVDTFLKSQFFKRIIVWGDCYLTYNDYQLYNDIKYRVIDEIEVAELLKYQINKSCITDLHFTVLFIPLMPEKFVAEILKDGHYGKPVSLFVGTSDADDMLDWRNGRSSDFFESDLFRKVQRVFGFTHDAEFLYEIFLNEA